MKMTLGLAVFTALLICCIHRTSAQDDVTVTSEPINTQIDPDAAEVFQYILDTVKKTNDGINTSALENAAKFVKENAARLTSYVSASDIDKAILQVAVRFDLEDEVQSLLSNKEQDPDPLKSDVLKIDEALQLWKALAESGNNEDESKVNATLAASSLIADRILTILPTLVRDVVYYAKENNIQGTADNPATIAVRRQEQEEPTHRNKRFRICVKFVLEVCVEWKRIRRPWG